MSLFFFEDTDFSALELARLYCIEKRRQIFKFFYVVKLYRSQMRQNELILSSDIIQINRTHDFVIQQSEAFPRTLYHETENKTPNHYIRCEKVEKFYSRFPLYTVVKLFIVTSFVPALGTSRQTLQALQLRTQIFPGPALRRNIL